MNGYSLTEWSVTIICMCNNCQSQVTTTADAPYAEESIEEHQLEIEDIRGNSTDNNMDENDVHNDKCSASSAKDFHVRNGVKDTEEASSTDDNAKSCNNDESGSHN